MSWNQLVSDKNRYRKLPKLCHIFSITIHYFKTPMKPIAKNCPPYPSHANHSPHLRTIKPHCRSFNTFKHMGHFKKSNIVQSLKYRSIKRPISTLKQLKAKMTLKKYISYIGLFYFLKIIVLTSEKYSYNESLRHKNSCLHALYPLKISLNHNLKDT